MISSYDKFYKVYPTDILVLGEYSKDISKKLGLFNWHSFNNLVL